MSVVFSRVRGWEVGDRWSLELAFVLGPDFGSGRFSQRIGKVERLDDGRIVVENRGSRELLVFDASGRILDAWGGPGEGPGEYRYTAGIFRCDAGRLAVIDNFRWLTILDARGTFVERRPLPPEVRGNGREIRGVGKDCGSLFVTTWGGPDDFMPTGIGTHSVMRRFLRVHLGPALSSAQISGIDTIGPLPGEESISVGGSDWQTRRVQLFLLPYRPNWATDGERVYYGWGDRPEVAIFSGGGTLRRLIRWRPGPSPITEEDWLSYRAFRRMRIAQNPDNEGRFQPPRSAEHPHPIRPYFGPPEGESESSFRVSDSGYLWVRHATPVWVVDEDRESGTVPWSVFDPDGRWLGEVEIPAEVRVVNVRGELLLALYEDEFGLEEVRAYRILGYPGGG